MNKIQPKPVVLKEIFKKIEDDKLVLPDFQREFVWKEEKQRNLLASLFCNMPIGTILTLEANDSGKYKINRIGTKIVNKTKNKKCTLLLDGQQRITTLTNIFTLIINKNVDDKNDLIDLELDFKWYLRLPKFSYLYDENFKQKKNNFLGINKFVYPEEKKFLPDDILDYFVKLKKNNLSKIENVKKVIMLSEDDYYLFPFYVIGEGKTLYSQVKKYIANLYKDEVINMIDKFSQKEYIEIVKKIFDIRIKNNKNYKDVFAKEIEDKISGWMETFTENLNDIYSNPNFYEINIEDEDRSVAISLYKNMNLGGVPLGEFDLLSAQYALESKISLRDDIKNNLLKFSIKKKEMEKLTPDNYYERNNDYYPIRILKCVQYNENEGQWEFKDKIDDIIINLFINVYKIFCSYEKIGKICMHKNILDVEPQLLKKNLTLIIEAICKTLYVFNIRFGIRKISDVNYKNMLYVVATIFLLYPKAFECKYIDKIEAWYWSSVFGGHYIIAQNEIALKDIEEILKCIKQKDYKYIKNLKNNILSEKNYSDLETMVMENKDHLPNENFKHYFDGFLLSKGYDSISKNVKISVFTNEQLDSDHIYSLKYLAKKGEDVKELRKKKDFIGNSPINKVLLLKDDNLDKLCEDPKDYYSKAKSDVLGALLINQTDFDSLESDKIKKLKNFIEKRHDHFKNEIAKKVSRLLE